MSRITLPVSLSDVLGSLTAKVVDGGRPEKCGAAHLLGGRVVVDASKQVIVDCELHRLHVDKGDG